jgi:hypothetical protein
MIRFVVVCASCSLTPDFQGAAGEILKMQDRIRGTAIRGTAIRGTAIRGTAIRGAAIGSEFR